MAGGFWFFTDYKSLANQAPADAFGPVAGSATQFRVTDGHTSKTGLPGPARAYAICQGLVRARVDSGGGVTLVLKPTQQPPFDFPFISYFLYKGIDPASLLQGGANSPLLDVSADTDNNELIAAVKKSWAANGNTGAPGRECLGLHLDGSLDSDLYGPTHPIDNLFYRGDGSFPAVLVQPGDTVGDFLTSGFGLDIIIERIGRPAPIRYATTRVNVIEAPAPPVGTFPPNDRAAFMSRHEREAILDFVDPCAFWGSFFRHGLKATGAPSRIAGEDVYSTLLSGSGATNSLFVNRNEAYIDIRDDHGHSMNYYRSTGDEIQLTLDPELLPVPLVNYYDQGWPSFAVPQPTTPLPDAAGVTLRFALPAAPGSQAITYVSVGYKASRRRVRPVAAQERLIVAELTSEGFSQLAPLGVPLIEANGARTIHASYQRIHHFRRMPAPGLQATPGADSVAPFYEHLTDHLFLIPGLDPLPRASAGCTIKTFSDLVLVHCPTGRFTTVVARPGIAQDQTNVYLFLLPIAGNNWKESAVFGVSFPAVEELLSGEFRPDLRLHSGDRLSADSIQVANGSQTTVQLLEEQRRPATNQDQSDNFWVIAMSITEYHDAIQGISALSGTASLSLGSARIDVDGDRSYFRLSTTLSYVQAPSSSALVDRTAVSPFGTVYRDASP